MYNCLLVSLNLLRIMFYCLFSSEPCIYNCSFVSHSICVQLFTCCSEIDMRDCLLVALNLICVIVHLLL